MNIFILDKSPILAAQFTCDKHCLKQVLESAQLLCTAHHILDKEKIKIGSVIVGRSGELTTLYKPTHTNHPRSVWVRQSSANYKWLVEYALELCKEYTKRYGKTHKCQTLLNNLSFNFPLNIPKNKLTEFPQCMPEIYKNKDVVLAYRQYYLGDKKRFARWKNGNIPKWWS
jgi:hypothetical protein